VDRLNITLLKELGLTWNDGCYKHFAPNGAKNEANLLAGKPEAFRTSGGTAAKHKLR
jgi:hypothetical protein